jgi:hypothetical protein
MNSIKIDIPSPQFTFLQFFLRLIMRNESVKHKSYQQLLSYASS